MWRVPARIVFRYKKEQHIKILWELTDKKRKIHKINASSSVWQKKTNEFFRQQDGDADPLHEPMEGVEMAEQQDDQEEEADEDKDEEEEEEEDEDESESEDEQEEEDEEEEAPQEQGSTHHLDADSDDETWPEEEDNENDGDYKMRWDGRPIKSQYYSLKKRSK